MIDAEILMGNKDNAAAIAKELTSEDISTLVRLLDEKMDALRYPAFLVLQERSRQKGDVYPYWDVLAGKLDSDNSYQRSIGIMLLAENIRWDQDERFFALIEKYLAHCRDEKFITSRQTVQSISVWIADKPQFYQPVFEALATIDIDTLKDTQKKLILLDILAVFLQIRKIKESPAIDDYIVKVLTGGLLDKKTVKEIENKIGK